MNFKTVFISDIHLGTKHTQVNKLIDFLNNNTYENIYLVGDIIDIWALERKVFLPENQIELIRLLFKKFQEGINIVYIPGNHDELIRKYLPYKYKNFTLINSIIHETSDGKMLFIIHGDQFDDVILNTKWIAKIGDIIYTILLDVTVFVNIIRNKLNLPYWSLSKYLKYKTKQVTKFISNYEDRVVNKIKEMNLDGVICGHIHHPEISMKNGILYANCGDWIENCSVLVEEMDGSLKIYYE